jgi:hypothetical protein
MRTFENLNGTFSCFHFDDLHQVIASSKTIRADCLMVALDATEILDRELETFAEAFVSQQLGYVVIWGPGCQRVENAFDLVWVNQHLHDMDDVPVLMTTSHHDEPLAEALWFCENLAYPETQGSEKRRIAVVCINDAKWKTEIEEYLSCST